MRLRWLPLIACVGGAITSCDPLPPRYSSPPYDPAQDPSAGGQTGDETPPKPAADPGRVVSASSEFVFNGGHIELQLVQAGRRVTQIAHNHYMVPIVMEFEATGLDNLSATSATRAVVVLPAAKAPNSEGPEVQLVTFDIRDPHRGYFRNFDIHARFGDPRARPAAYAYALPYQHKTFSVLQGFHGAFSHRGSNEYAVDFDCPVATPVIAARPGVVVVSNDAAQGSGTTPEFLDYKRVNFVLVMHDDGTLGEYMHLSPSGVEVAPGQRVERGQQLALSGNTGFSSTPHLHFQVMTAGDDGLGARSFPFQLATSHDRVEEPVQGRSYPAWE